VRLRKGNEEERKRRNFEAQNGLAQGKIQNTKGEFEFRDGVI
jgi:hypothetical protein